jgi:hypothetical protein
MLHPLDKVILRDGRNRTSCGHSISLKEIRNLLLISNQIIGPLKCPVCQSPIAYVQDGVVVASNDFSVANQTNPSSTSELGTVYFKYGKYLFHLAIDARQSSSFLGIWNPMQYYFSSSTGLAQQRISNVLGIPLKKLQIIYQGKIVYPATTERMSEHDLSVRLQMLSHTKSTLVVLGTPCRSPGHKLLYHHKWVKIGIGVFLIGYISIRFLT